jgi:aryl-alcohol dehydrogenase-like predicted oxidoreductase
LGSLGINVTWFDTADVYGKGAAEAAWGEILSAHPRDSYVLATKVGGGGTGLAAAHIHEAIDASLSRLQTDYVDLYQAHRPDPTVPIEDTVEAFQQVVQSGKARYLGFSEWTPEQIQAAIDIGGPDFFVSSQPQYSILWQAPETEVFPLCQANGISQIVWSPLAQGLLTGKYRPGEDYPADSRFAKDSMNGAMGIVASDEAISAVQDLLPVAEDAGLTLVELALAWVLRRGELASAIIGASRPAQVHQDAKASGIKLSDDVLAAIDAAVAGVAVKKPTLAPFAREGVLHR